MRILHIASFIGNFGDRINHQGLYNLLDNILNKEYKITQFEIRETYKTNNLNTELFIRLCNKHDLVIFGGGGFFEAWVDYSMNGSSINISIETILRTHTKILFFALGTNINKNVKLYEKKLVDFLVKVKDLDNVYITFRNDGTRNHFINMNSELDSIFSIPDGAFINNFKDLSADYIVINLAGDDLKTRFNRKNSSFTYDEFTFKFAKFIEQLLHKFNKRYRVIFAAHIFYDLKIVHDVLIHIDHIIVRRNIDVITHNTFDELNKFIEVYQKAALVIGQRFHSNVLAFVIGKPIIGLVNLDQIEYTHIELNSKNFIKLSQSDFFEKLYCRSVRRLNNYSGYSKNIQLLTYKFMTSKEIELESLRGFIENSK